MLINKKIKFFIQVNIGEENQKNGVSSEDLFELYNYCKQLDLNVIGLMCIPPFDQSSENFFNKMKILKEKLNSSDYRYFRTAPGKF